MTRARAALCCALLAGCGKRAELAPSSAEPPAMVTLELATDPGLSGLAVDASGALWTVSERGGAAYRIVIDGDRVASLDRIPIGGIASGLDLEAIEVLVDGRLAFGTERHDDSTATVLLGTWSGQGEARVLTVTPALDATPAATAPANHGVEGVCALDGTLVFGLEGVVERDGARVAPVMVAQLGVTMPTVAHHVALTTATGKLSAFDCASGRDGAIDVLAIERHFEVSRLIRFEVPVTASATPLTATVLLDLADLAAGRNFEGVARLPDGRIALVNDNQWRTITGPSELVILPSPL